MDDDLFPVTPATLASLPPAPTGVVVAPPSPAEQMQTDLVAAMADTLHKIDIRAHLELLARTEPRTFRSWVEMLLPKQQQRGSQQALILNMHSPLPKSPLDGLPPGFDIHR